ncbi:Hypothetical protein D9617_17g046230 [Elsinoe fawcettii]|nr:Hypothetical protein D9617_17g046230 [Elsinoe fawcettii]
MRAVYIPPRSCVLFRVSVSRGKGDIPGSLPLRTYDVIIIPSLPSRLLNPQHRISFTLLHSTSIPSSYHIVLPFPLRQVIALHTEIYLPPSPWIHPRITPLLVTFNNTVRTSTDPNTSFTILILTTLFSLVRGTEQIKTEDTDTSDSFEPEKEISQLFPQCEHSGTPQETQLGNEYPPENRDSSDSQHAPDQQPVSAASFLSVDAAGDLQCHT